MSKDNLFEITIQSYTSIDTFYKVVKTKRGKWQCSCPHYIYRHVSCKHIKEAMRELKLRKSFKNERITDAIIREFTKD